MKESTHVFCPTVEVVSILNQSESRAGVLTVMLRDCLVSLWNDLHLHVCYRINQRKMSATRLTLIRKQLLNTSWVSNAVRFQEAENRVAGCEEERGKAWQREIQSAELRQMSGASESTGCFLQPVQNVQSPRVWKLPHLPWWGNLVVQCVCQRVVRDCLLSPFNKYLTFTNILSTLKSI